MKPQTLYVMPLMQLHEQEGKIYFTFEIFVSLEFSGWTYSYNPITGELGDITSNQELLYCNQARKNCGLIGYITAKHAKKEAVLLAAQQVKLNTPINEIKIV